MFGELCVRLTRPILPDDALGLPEYPPDGMVFFSSQPEIGQERNTFMYFLASRKSVRKIFHRGSPTMPDLHTSDD